MAVLLRRGFAAAHLLDCGFESRQWHVCLYLSLSFMSVVRRQDEVSGTGRSIVQRNPTECCVPNRV